MDHGWIYNHHCRSGMFMALVLIISYMERTTTASQFITGFIATLGTLRLRSIFRNPQIMVSCEEIPLGSCINCSCNFFIDKKRWGGGENIKRDYLEKI